MNAPHTTIKEFEAEGFTHIECHRPALLRDTAAADGLQRIFLGRTVAKLMERSNHERQRLNEFIRRDCYLRGICQPDKFRAGNSLGGHNALLLANSLIIGALAISPAALWQNTWGALTMLGAGLIISAAWAGIAMTGWSILWRHADLASTFASESFKHLPNPFGTSKREESRLHLLVMLVIAVFVFMYLGLGLRFSLAWD